MAFKNAAVDRVVECLATNTKMITTTVQVATISANGMSTLATSIAQAWGMSGRRMSSRSRSATIEDKIEITEGMRFDAIRDEEPAVTDMRSQKVDFEKRLRLAGFGDNPNVILGDLAILTGTRRHPLYQYYEGGPDRPRRLRVQRLHPHSLRANQEHLSPILRPPSATNRSGRVVWLNSVAAAWPLLRLAGVLRSRLGGRRISMAMR